MLLIVDVQAWPPRGSWCDSRPTNPQHSIFFDIHMLVSISNQTTFRLRPRLGPCAAGRMGPVFSYLSVGNVVVPSVGVMPRLANSPAQPLLHPLRMTSLRNGLGAPSPCASTAEVICTLLVTQARYTSRHPMQPSDPRRRPLRRNTQQAQSCMQRHKRHLVPAETIHS